MHTAGSFLIDKNVSRQKDTRTLKDKRNKAAAAAEKTADDGWERLMKIREELGKGWQSEKSAVEILSEMRR